MSNMKETRTPMAQEDRDGGLCLDKPGNTDNLKLTGNKNSALRSISRLETRCKQLSEEIQEVRHILRASAYSNPIYQQAGCTYPAMTGNPGVHIDVFDEPAPRPSIDRMIRDVERHLDSADSLICAAAAHKSSLQHEVYLLTERVGGLEAGLKLVLEHLPSVCR